MSDENTCHFNKNDVGIHPYHENVSNSLTTFLQSSEITVVTDQSSGGIIFSLKFKDETMSSPFYQYIFGETYDTREQQPVQEIFLKLMLYSSDFYKGDYQFDNVILYSMDKNDIQKEYDLHVNIFSQNHQFNVGYWVNIPFPIDLQFYENESEKQNQLRIIHDHGESRVKTMIEELIPNFINTNKCHLAFFFMEKINGTSLLDFQTDYMVAHSVQPSVMIAVPRTVGKLEDTFDEIINKNIISKEDQFQISQLQKFQMHYYNLYVYQLYKLYANGNGFIHNDIHSGNVLYDKTKDIVYLIDFARSEPCSYIQQKYNDMRNKRRELLTTTSEIEKLTKEFNFFPFRTHIQTYNDVLRNIFEGDCESLSNFIDYYESEDISDLTEQYKEQFQKDVEEIKKYNFEKAIEWNFFMFNNHIDLSVAKELSEYVDIIYSYIYVYFEQLLPQLQTYENTYPDEIFKIQVIKSLLYNYIGLETKISQHSIFDTEYKENKNYQWYFYYYIKPLLHIQDDQITIQFDSPNVTELCDFISDRFVEDGERSKSFYCEPSSEMPPSFKRKRTEKSARHTLGGRRKTKKQMKKKSNRKKRR